MMTFALQAVVFESKIIDTQVSIFTKEAPDLHLKLKRLSIRATLEEWLSDHGRWPACERQHSTSSWLKLGLL